MTGTDDRFRKLGHRAGDLFDHFGVAVDPSVQEANVPAASPPIAAYVCEACTWILPERTSSPRCPICGTPTTPRKSP